jgi:hypothetical protein
MRTDEDIRGYQDRVEAIVHKIRSLGGNLEDDKVTKRVLRIVTRTFEPKVFILEEQAKTPSSELVFDTLPL